MHQDLIRAKTGLPLDFEWVGDVGLFDREAWGEPDTFRLFGLGTVTPRLP